MFLAMRRTVCGSPVASRARIAIGPLTNACATPQKVKIMGGEWPDAATALGKTEFHNLTVANERRAQIVGDLFPGRIETLEKYLSFFCAMIPRFVWDKMGPLDPAFWPCLGEDNDYCMRLAEATPSNRRHLR